MATADHANTNTGVVIRGIAADRGVGGIPQINALLIRVVLGSNTSVANMVIDDGDVVRSIHVDALIAGIVMVKPSITM